jgi:lipopolysaccharide transport system ATP-binding protein
MSSEPAIELKDVSKAYQVYTEPKDRLRQAFLPRLRRLARPIGQNLGIEIAQCNYFKSFSALQSLSFHVARGETLGVIGQNGSGKSTLLKLICGTLEPTTGEVITNGRIGALLELGSGFNPEYTGRENVLLNASVLGLSPDQIEERLEDILAFADIGDFAEQPVKTYSSGMAMRLAFAVIAHVDADILVIDEALAVGDVYFQQKCMRWLRQFRERGTVLFCGHDTSSVINLCQRAIWLDRGEMRLIGEAKEVVEAYSAFMHVKAAGLPEEVVRFRPVATKSSPVSALDTQTEDTVTPKAPKQLPPPDFPADRPAVFDWLSESSSFGSREGEITATLFTYADGDPLLWIEGGEAVKLSVEVRAAADIDTPIVGFFVKDRLGQPLTGTNTFTRRVELPPLTAEQELRVEFSFQLPLFETGRYTITVAIATGSIESHVQLHWVHDAIVFDVHSTHKDGVLIAPEMKQIEVFSSKPSAVSGVKSYVK